MPDTTEATAGVRDASNDGAREPSNNQLAHDRDGKIRRSLRRGPKTTEDLVAEGIFTHERHAARRMKKIENKKHGGVKFVGWVHIDGKTLKLWFWRELTNPQHEAEISRIARLLKVRDVLRFTRIPPEWRKLYSIDAVIQSLDKLYFWEHDKDTEQEKQIIDKMRKLAECHVLWTCPHEERLTELIGLAPTDNHWFTTYDQIISDPHGPIFQNRIGERESLEIDDRYGVQSDVQSDTEDQP